jgi:hypothetical protein
MARHLPPTITLQPGSLVITGAHSTEIFENLVLLVRCSFQQDDNGSGCDESAAYRPISG